MKLLAFLYILANFVLTVGFFYVIWHFVEKFW